MKSTHLVSFHPAVNGCHLNFLNSTVSCGRDLLEDRQDVYMEHGLAPEVYYVLARAAGQRGTSARGGGIAPSPMLVPLPLALAEGKQE